MATRLPDGSVVVRTPGSRAYPAGGSGATVARAPGTRAGGGPGVGGKAAAVVRSNPRQPVARTAV